MRRMFTRGKLLLMAAALGLAVLALAACGSGSTPSADGGAATGQPAQSADLASVLRSQLGAAAYEQLLQGSIGPTNNSTSGIWVSGQGEASAPPDLAILNMGVEAFAATVAEARSNGAAAMEQVLDLLKASGIADRDIQTRFFNISPRYTTHEITRCVASGELEAPTAEPEAVPQGAPAQPTGEASVSESSGVATVQVLPQGKPERRENCVVERERVILGYDVNNQLSVKVRELGSIGTVIDGATAAGGDLIRFQGVSFSIEDTKALQDEARAAAIEELMAKAQQIAALTGVELGPLVFLADSGGPIVSPTIVQERAMFAASAVSSPIQVGELDVRVSLQAAFEIKR